jgi:hypothetical protein
LETLLGLCDDPGDLDGYGPVAARMARDLATDAIWRCIVVDTTHGTVLGVGKSTYTPAYTPGAALTRFLADAAPHCAVPGCTIRGWRCDQDHRVPYPNGPTCECNIRPLCRRHHRLKTAGLLTITRSTDPGDPPGTLTFTTRTDRSYPALPHAPLPMERPEAQRAGTERAGTKRAEAKRAGTAPAATRRAAALRRHAAALADETPPPF